MRVHTDYSFISNEILTYFSYECVYERKQLVLKSDMALEKADSMATTIVTNCQMNGTYDKMIADYTCTKVCPHPTNPDPGLFEIDHNSTIDEKPEINDQVKYWCKHDKKLVTKNAFATGKPTELLDEMMSMCQITGWLNETIEQYTCTQNCEAPYNYTEILNYDYIEDGSTDIGTKVIYKCPDTRKKVVKIENIEEGDDTSLKDELETECLYNGQWSPVVVDYGCTGEFFLKNSGFQLLVSNIPFYSLQNLS